MVGLFTSGPEPPRTQSVAEALGVIEDHVHKALVRGRLDETTGE